MVISFTPLIAVFDVRNKNITQHTTQKTHTHTVLCDEISKINSI